MENILFFILILLFIVCIFYKLSTVTRNFIALGSPLVLVIMLVYLYENQIFGAATIIGILTLFFILLIVTPTIIANTVNGTYALLTLFITVPYMAFTLFIAYYTVFEQTTENIRNAGIITLIYTIIVPAICLMYKQK